MAGPGDAIRRALGGRPQRRAPRGKRPGPATVISRKQPRELTYGDFTAASPVTGRLSRLAEFQVPRGELWEVDALRPFRLHLKAKVSFSGVSFDGSGEATLDFGAEGVEIIDSGRNPAPGAGVTTHKDVVAIRDDNGNKLGITAIDYDANTVDVDGGPTSTTQDVTGYALCGNGDVRVRAVQPSGVDDAAVELFNDSLAAVHETDQADGETAPRFSRGGMPRYPLPPKWLLTIAVDSSAELVWEDDAEQQVKIHAYRAPIEVRDLAELNRRAARMLRG